MRSLVNGRKIILENDTTIPAVPYLPALLLLNKPKGLPV